jgi:capsular exopolysaccharide synthesis family protein
MAKTPVSIIDFYNIESGIATEFSRLLNNIQNLEKEREIKSILITSSMLSEGKSTVCAFFSMTAASKGLKTLLIDTDLRRPTLHKLFSLPREQGLAEILTDGLLAKNVVKKTPLEKLDLISAGKNTPVPAEIFDAQMIGGIISEMKFYYDLIVLDCAPIIPVSDPMLLAKEVDGVIFIVKAGSTPRDVVLRAKDIITSSTNKVLGVVVNNAESSLPYYYNHDYYGYDYPQSLSGRKKDKANNSSGRESTGNLDNNGQKKESKKKDTASR